MNWTISLLAILSLSACSNGDKTPTPEPTKDRPHVTDKAQIHVPGECPAFDGFYADSKNRGYKFYDGEFGQFTLSDLNGENPIVIDGHVYTDETGHEGVAYCSAGKLYAEWVEDFTKVSIVLEMTEAGDCAATIKDQRGSRTTVYLRQ